MWHRIHDPKPTPETYQQYRHVFDISTPVADVAATEALLSVDNDVSSAVSTLLAGNTPSPKSLLGQSEASDEQGRPSHLEGFGANLAEEAGEERDEEMEEELTKGVKGDPYAEYDVSVNEETEAIEEYLALIESSLLAK